MSLFISEFTLELLLASQRAQIGETPKVLLRLLSEALSEPRVLSRNSLWGTTRRALSRALSYPISESTSESSLGSTFGGFPDLGPLADQRNFKGTLEFSWLLTWEVPRHASAFGTHSNTQAVSGFHWYDCLTCFRHACVETRRRAVYWDRKGTTKKTQWQRFCRTFGWTFW